MCNGRDDERRGGGSGKAVQPKKELLVNIEKNKQRSTHKDKIRKLADDNDDLRLHGYEIIVSESITIKGQATYPTMQVKPS